jgi:O-antigen/teichoic acid export membrane protein
VVLFSFTSENVLDDLFSETGVGAVLHLMVTGIPFYALILLLSSSYIGFKKIRYQVFTEVVGLPLFQVVTAVVIFYIVGNGIDSWVKGYVFSLFLMAVVSSVIFFKKIWINLSHISRESLDYKEVINYAWPLTISAALTLVLGREIDFVLLGIFGSARDVGIYRVYLYFVMPLQVMVASLAQIYQPTVTELIAQGQLEETIANFKKISKWTLQINILLMLLLFFGGEALVYYFFGKDFIVSPGVLSILAIGKVLDSSVGPTLMTLEAFGKSRLILFNSILVVVLQVGLAYLLIPRFGLVGAGIARAFSFVLTNYIELLEVWWFYNITPFNSSYGWTCVSGFVALLAGFGVQYGLRYSSMVVAGGVAFLSSTLIYTVLLFTTIAFDSEDYQILIDLFERLKTKFFAKAVKGIL